MRREVLEAAARKYAAEVGALRRSANTTEATFYPAICELLNALLQGRDLPFRARTGTSEDRLGGGADKPDVVIYDAEGAGTIAAGEVKLPAVALRALANSTDRNDQVGRYLAQTGAVLLCNVRSFGLLTVKPGVVRNAAMPVRPEDRVLVAEVMLWEDDRSAESGQPIEPARMLDLASLVFQAATEYAPINRPDVLARILAEQARSAKAGLPARFDESVQQLLLDYKEALGLSFEDDEGKEFFRSSLIQTAYYALFAGWTLWHRANDGTAFAWEKLDRYLRIPFLGQLFHEFRHPDRLADLRLGPHLDRATAMLARVDRDAFFHRFGVPNLSPDAGAGNGHDVAAAAITYFYEPFLEAFDPELRKALGVWYTPPAIVRYQVRKVDRLLRDELGCERGLADPHVVVLDPCCGTGAYLIEVVRCIAEQLRSEGEDGSLGAEILEAVCTRVLGFELLTASFVIAQLQLYLILSELGTPPGKDRRPAVFLTNALTGWSGEEQVKLNFPELREERDAARKVKREAKIIVILGNPPYNRWAGAAIEEERDLVDQYKGITRDRDGRQVGPSQLYARWGIRKHLLDDLYVRFFRLAEKQIGEKAEFGVVSFISNSSFLTGRSHPIMRESLVAHFDKVWIDSLNGDKYRTGKLIPKDLPGTGTSDQSVFTTEQDPRGIQVGTSITTYLKLRTPRAARRLAMGHYREFWGLAERKRQALLESLRLSALSPAKQREVAKRPEGPRQYEEFTPNEGNRWKLAPRDENAGFEAWPALDELFPTAFQGVNPNRGLDGSLVDVDRAALAQRMRAYFAARSFREAEQAAPELCVPRARYVPRDVWQTLSRGSGFDEGRIVPYTLFPLDGRWIYYETNEKLLNERRPEFWDNLGGNEFLVTVPQPRRASETRPLIATTLVDLHLHDRGSVCFPRTVKAPPAASGGLFSGPPAGANLAPRAWSSLSKHWKLKGDIGGPAASRIVADLFRVALALMHAPQYETDHQESLAQDWAHLPIPRSLDLLGKLVEAGDAAAKLLDPMAGADKVVRELLGEDAGALGVLTKVGGGAVRDEARVVTVSYYGAARGRYDLRRTATSEPMRPAWGETTGDLYLNDTAFFRHVPEAVWRYELGGYPVLKKWLGYRQASRRGDRPLTVPEARHARSIIQRLAALLVLRDKLDALYAEACADAWSAEELGLR